MLRGLGEQEVREVLKEQGAVTVTCDFCNRPYTYDAAAVDALFATEGGAAAGQSAGPDAVHNRDSDRSLH